MIICLINQKGGVGKSTLAAHLSLKAVGKTLLIDLDPQASATFLTGLKPSNGTYSFLKGNPLESVIKKSPWGFDVLPADISLAKFEHEENDGTELAKKLDKNKYDHIFIDCPPSVGFLSLNALAASDRAIIAVEPSLLSIYGLGQILDSIELVQKNYNSKLEFFGVIINKATRTNEAQKIIEELTLSLGKDKILAVVPSRIAVVEGARQSKPCESLAFELSLEPVLEVIND